MTAVRLHVWEMRPLAMYSIAEHVLPSAPEGRISSANP